MEPMPPPLALALNPSTRRPGSISLHGMQNTRSLTAFNTATASENKIHDDAVASKFGFTGGLVPGVDVFAYLAHMPAEAWGKAWLRGGAMRARFLKPIYDGDMATTTATPEGDSALTLAISARGNLCATGEARLGGAVTPAEVLPEAPMPAPEDRPPASQASLPKGLVLGSIHEPYTRDIGLEHLAATREDPELFDDGRIANPAWLLRRANYILADNVRLGPWIHVESDIILHDLLNEDERIDVRAVVQDNFESKGHLTVALDFQILSGKRFIMSGRHWAIYEPRQVRQAG
jgi:hypothetical protein